MIEWHHPIRIWVIVDTTHKDATHVGCRGLNQVDRE